MYPCHNLECCISLLSKCNRVFIFISESVSTISTSDNISLSCVLFNKFLCCNLEENVEGSKFSISKFRSAYVSIFINFKSFYLNNTPFSAKINRTKSFFLFSAGYSEKYSLSLPLPKFLKCSFVLVSKILKCQKRSS